MSIRPNRYGPNCPLGELTVPIAGTSVLLSNNFETGYKYDPNTPVSDTEKQQYAVGFEDIIINSPPANAGGLYITTRGGSKNTPDSILLYVPKGSPPVSMKHFVGGGRFNPNSMGLDADQDGDKAWLNGIVGS